MRHSRIAIVLLSLVTLTLAACEQKSPQEKVAALRAKYTATVNASGFAARAIVPEPAMDEESMNGEGMDGDAPEPMADGEAEVADGDVAMDAGAGDDLLAPPDLAPLRYDILLDIIVATKSREPLPQLTVDVVHLDSGKTEKERWQVTLDTSGVMQGPGAQITHEIENVEYVEGDIFFTEVRHPIPAAEISKYPELANAG